MGSPNGANGSVPAMAFASIGDATAALGAGSFVLLFDSEKREAETDFLVLAEHVTPKHIATMRRDGGGLVFVAVGHGPAKKLGLPFMHDVLAQASGRWPILAHLVPNGLPYDARSSFSLWLNHRDTFTGITDIDRALTVKEFAKLAKRTEAIEETSARRALTEQFRSPGHVPFCVAAAKGLEERKGHTELAVALAELAGAAPVLVGCEMMDEHTGRALTKVDALKYAAQNGIPILEGRQVLEAHARWKSQVPVVRRSV